MTKNEIVNLLDRIKNLQYFEVVIPIPPQAFYCNGKIPFTFRISDEVMVCSVLAASYEEASIKVEEFLDGSG